ncbi:Crp/Fnr family transcriptional regulator [Larkinella soli]|uniref:Crp/Fnr family transcriptional regulator n=1 Tax=Larkinella soli TaxID=1770527 RepID=UPI000FFC3F4F|nr:Crp/Fnr family transcriptional regulator [Larkinella soli]
MVIRQITDNDLSVICVTSMGQILLDQLSAIHPLTPDAVLELNNRILFQKLPAGTKLPAQEERTPRVYFIGCGLVRVYSWKKEKEVTLWLAHENDLAFTTDCLFLKRESLVRIELLEPSEIYSLSVVELEMLYERFPEINAIARVVLQRHLFARENLKGLLRHASAEERVEEFRKSNPELWKRTQNQYIASYLGINPATLSRILKKTGQKIINLLSGFLIFRKGGFSILPGFLISVFSFFDNCQVRKIKTVVPLCIQLKD